jgi:hypothetical protein
MMSPRWNRLFRVTCVLAFAGWLSGAVIMATDADKGMLEAAIHPVSVRAFAAGIVAALAFGPLFGWTRIPTWAGALLGIPAGVLGVFAFFYIWPHEFQPSRMDSWKPTGIVLGVYWKWLVPIVLAAGALANRLASAAPPIPKGQAWEDLIEEHPAQEPPADDTKGA